MKRCPTCRRTYPDDTLAFCLIDGSVLSAPFEPDEPTLTPSPRGSDVTPTEILNTGAAQPTIPAAQPAETYASPKQTASFQIGSPELTVRSIIVGLVVA